MTTHTCDRCHESAIKAGIPDLGQPLDLVDVAMAILSIKPLPQRCPQYPACSLVAGHAGEHQRASRASLTTEGGAL